MSLRKLKSANNQSRIQDKKAFKLQEGKCRICGEDDYDLLDSHRIKAGADGGKYTRANTIVCCCKCHRLIHSDKIQIIGWVKSTAGKLLHIIENDEEKFL